MKLVITCVTYRPTYLIHSCVIARGTDFADVLTFSMLFTCALSRAVYLETALSISMESYLRQFQRFAIYLDNAPAFRRTELLLKLLFQLFEDKIRIRI